MFDVVFLFRFSKMAALTIRAQIDSSSITALSKSPSIDRTSLFTKVSWSSDRKFGILDSLPYKVNPKDFITS